jgi:hypothetical protein
VKDWAVTCVAFTFYVPTKGDHGPMAWNDLAERDDVVMMLSDRAIESTGENGENCHMRKMLPLYMGDGGNFDKPFCCYGNEVDCTRCGAYGVFNSAFHRKQGQPAPAPNS